MALPLLNDTPKYEMKIPSTGKKVRFRPYLVKEEKILMIAAESKDIHQITRAVVDTIVTCCDGKVNKKDLTTFDVEYMFLQLRAKSVGENISLKINCEECGTPNDQEVNLDSITVNVAKKDNIIKLSDKISVEMSYPSYEMMNFDADANEAGFMILGKCIKAVITEDERIDLADETDESIKNFIESMTQGQFEKITSYMQDIPTVKHDINFTCQGCNHNNNILLQGMQSFF